MITSELYPSLPDRAQGFEVSDFIENLDYGTNADHPLRPYTMGYINFEDYPDFINLSEVIATFEEGGENSIKIQPITEPANHAWGYCGRKISSQDFSSYSTAPFNIVKDENDVWRAKGIADNTNYGSICLINGGYLATYSLYNRFILELSISITTDNNLKPNGFTSDGGISTVSEFLDFCNGDRALTFTYNQHEYEINISDFDINGYVVLRDIDDTLTFVVGITNYRFNNRGTGSSGGDYLGIIPWIEMEIDGQTYYVNAEATGGADISDVRIYTNWGSSPMVIGNVVGNVYGNKFMFNLKGEISYAQIQAWAKSYDTEMVHYVQELNCFRSYTGWSQATGYQWKLIPIFKPLGIKTLLALRLKRFTGQETALVPPANQYYTTDVDTNKYNSSDVPTFEIINGEYQDIEGELRPWQMWEVDITENTFDPSDIPPYRPGPVPGPSDKDEGTIGINIPGALGATNAFVTRYVLNTTQIRTIGQSLWSTIRDGNQPTWENFFMTITGSDKIDYSLTLSEIISYFISLKYFPFSLSSISTSTGLNGIKVGTGASVINAGSATKTLTDSIIMLDGGYCSVPNKWGNYLDIEPYTTATIYIPYCGTTELPMSIITGAQLGLDYLVDITTGAMTAVVTKYSAGASFPIATMSGSCGFDILMTGTNGNSQMTNAISNLASKSAQWTGNILQSGLTGIMSGVGGGSGMGALSSMGHTVLGIGQDMIQNNIQMPKLYATAPMIAGSSSSLSSLILPQTAYIQIRRHNPYSSLGEAGTYKDDIGPLLGYRSSFFGKVGSANGMGFVKCINPVLNEVSSKGATEQEIQMIKKLLSDGIYT